MRIVICPVIALYAADTDKVFGSPLEGQGGMMAVNLQKEHDELQQRVWELENLLREIWTDGEAVKQTKAEVEKIVDDNYKDRVKLWEALKAWCKG